ncbi:MAG: excinuclease ABC subunit UvrA [Candidatus Eiseniibacteriota bacterium]
MSSSFIRVRGAREHNLQNIDVDLPRNTLIVMTGLSGSGKSSLAFDTIYAEGQRRYVESLSAYARQFLGQMDKPDVDSIDGLSPAISIEQKGATRNPRSTVGTITEIYDYLRLLFARVGQPHCPNCGRKIVPQTIDQMTDTVLALGEGTRVQIFAPLVRGRKGEHEAALRAAKKDGFVRVRVDGEIHDLDRAPRLDKKRKHDVEVVVDRIVVKAASRARLADSLGTASRLGQGTVVLDVAGREEDLVLSESFACPDCGISLGEIEPRVFSFNSPYGACPACNGLGSRLSVDPALVVPDPELSIQDGALHPWRDAKSSWYRTMLRSVARHVGFDLSTPWKKLPARARQAVLHGTSTEIEFRWEGKRSSGTYKAPFDGLVPSLERRHRQSDNDRTRSQIERYMRSVSCADCEGTRLKPESRAVKVGSLGIAEVTRLQVDEARTFFRGLPLGTRERTIAGPVLKEIVERLDFLGNVGVGYLSLDRSGNSLSGGEAQRIRLATQLGSSLVGVLYILDEPSIGLHSRDHQRLLDSLLRLRDLGNTVLVVEHDRDTMLAADHLVDLGPGAGRNGGRIVSAGTPKQVMADAGSATGAYLAGTRRIEVPAVRRDPERGFLEVRGARQHNLRGLDVRFPLGRMVCVTGVSGSGKSTLVNGILARAAAAALHDARGLPGEHDEIRGLELLDKAIVIDQSPIGRTPRSNPATYTGVFTEIRALFAETKDARVRGYQPGRFSFNVKGGRCEACEGDGLVRIEMHFLPDVFVKCDECRGARYNRETLEIRYKGATIAEVLEMTVDEALEFLTNIPAVRSKLQVLSDVGLGYIHLGQSATTLSGGEAQRVKLATELARRSTGRTLYILDEPTTGLHFEDIKNLLGVLQLLVDRGNTVVVIEHNLDVIKCADHVIDLGPEGGRDGGTLVASGTPEEVARSEASHTGRALRAVLPGFEDGGRARRGGRRRPEKTDPTPDPAPAPAGS